MLSQTRNCPADGGGRGTVVNGRSHGPEAPGLGVGNGLDDAVVQHLRVAFQSLVVVDLPAPDTHGVELRQPILRGFFLNFFLHQGKNFLPVFHVLLFAAHQRQDRLSAHDLRQHLRPVSGVGGEHHEAVGSPINAVGGGLQRVTGVIAGPLGHFPGV